MKEKVKTLENIRSDMLKLFKNEDLDQTLVKKIKWLTVKRLGASAEKYFYYLVNESMYEILEETSNDVFIHYLAEKNGLNCREFKLRTKEKLLLLKKLIYQLTPEKEIIQWIDNFISEQLQPN